MTKLVPLRSLPRRAAYKPDDVLVLFGELFSRGYANGLVEEAERMGMKIIYSTVGRRTKDGELRALEENEFPKQSLLYANSKFINIPLEAGFDLEPDHAGVAPVDQLKEVKLGEWENVKINFESLKESQHRGTDRFKAQVKKYFLELENHIAPGSNVIFAHLMAGGVPRAKIVLPIMNRVFKGVGDRYVPSELFWSSDIGRFCALSFNEVTAETFKHLVDLSTSLREKIQNQGGKVRYLAYGYHGTEVLIQNQYIWQTYTPYLQGFAKVKLENYSEEFWNRGIKTSVFNCPEILTNSSSIFIGVENSLYPLLFSLNKIKDPSDKILQIVKSCTSLLKEACSMDEFQKLLDTYLNDELIRSHCDFLRWPQHSSKEQLELMINTSDKLVSCHRSEKLLISANLSEIVFESCGKIMLHQSWNPESPVWWIGHDIIAQQLGAN
jgi:hypothetical protein